MRKKRFLILIAFLMAACASAPPPPPPPPPPPAPTQVILEIETFGNLNPNPAGQPSPLVLRVYALKSPSLFNSADFISLYEKDKTLLGADLIQKHEFILQPNEKKTQRLVLPDDTRAIGAFAAFRQYQQAQWRALANVRPHESIVIHVRADGNNIEIR
ncbi:MAG: type VI secretion system lipoprotein TssJ [Syntrophobacter sp.]